MSFFPAGGATYTLQASISSTATTITLSSFTEPVSNVPYTMALLNTSIVYATIAPRTSSSEFISFTGITQNADGTATLTGVTRGLAKKYPFTESSTFKLPHSGQSQFILSDPPQLFNKYAVLENDNVFTGSNTVPTPVVDGNPATKAYVDTVAGGVTTTPRIVVTGIAGENVTADQLVYLKASDGKWWLCDADTASTVDNVQLGLTQGAGSADGNISGGVLTQGLATLTAFTVTAGTKYYASNTAGGISTSAGTTEVTIGEVPSGSTTTIYFYPRFDQQVTENELDAMVGGGDFGTPSNSNKFITQSYNSSATGLPVIKVFYNIFGSSTTQFDITNTVGTTYRYTFDGTGTDPLISATTVPVGTVLVIAAQNFTAANNGTFVVTASDTNYFEVTNASGVVESNKTLGTGTIKYGYQKPATLKYISVKGVGAGAGGTGGSGNSDTSGAGGGSGIYAEVIIPVASLSTTEIITIGAGGAGGAGVASGTPNVGSNGGSTSLGTLFVAGGGIGGSGTTGGATGTYSGSVTPVFSVGNPGGNKVVDTGSTPDFTTLGCGGDSFLGQGGPLRVSTTVGGNGSIAGANALGYGGGGSGAFNNNAGGNGYQGIIMITEYYS